MRGPARDLAVQVARERMAIALRHGERTNRVVGVAAAALWIWSATPSTLPIYLIVLACLMQGALALIAAMRFKDLSLAERDRQWLSFWWRNVVAGALHGGICATLAIAVIPNLAPDAQALGSVAILLLSAWLTNSGAFLRSSVFLANTLPAAVLLWIWWGEGGLRDAVASAAVLVLYVTLALGTRQNELSLRRKVLLHARNALLLKDAEHRSQLIESINRKKTEIVSAASHDLRQPVHALGLLVQRLRPGMLHEEQAPLFQQVRSRVSVISDMLGSLLDLSKFDSGGYKVRLDRIRLFDLVDELIELFSERVERKGLTLRVDVPDVDIQTDPALLKQILHNLVSNAIKYTRSGEISIRGSIARKRHLMLDICDTGVGIPSEHREEVFMEYYRLPEHRDGAEEGLGIGLALVQRAAGLLGYTLHLDSVVGKGSRFGVEIPARHVTAHRAPDFVAADTSPGELEGNECHTVLILENDEYANDAMARLVADWGYTVVAALDGQQLLERIRAAEHPRPSVFVSDMHLGEREDGLSYVRQIRQALGLPILPAILVTGDLSREVQQRANEEQVQILYKPLQPRLLRAALKDSLEAARRIN